VYGAQRRDHVFEHGVHIVLVEVDQPAQPVHRFDELLGL